MKPGQRPLPHHEHGVYLTLTPHELASLKQSVDRLWTIMDLLAQEVTELTGLEAVEHGIVEEVSRKLIVEAASLRAVLNRARQGGFYRATRTPSPDSPPF